jgi:hypothetical protein
VRGGQLDEGSQKLGSTLPGAPQSPGSSGKNPNPPAANKPGESPPAKPGDLQVFLGADGTRCCSKRSEESRPDLCSSIRTDAEPDSALRSE